MHFNSSAENKPTEKQKMRKNGKQTEKKRQRKPFLS